MSYPVFSDLPGGYLFIVYGAKLEKQGTTTEGDLAMIDPEGASQESELETESSTDEPGSSTNEPTVEASPFDVNPEAEKIGLEQAEGKGLTEDYQIEGEKAGAADYQTRLEAFDNVATPVPVESLPVKTPSREESDEA